MNYFELASDIRNIIRGGITSDDDTLDLRQVLFWIQTIYAEAAERDILSLPGGMPIPEMWVKRYECVNLTYPASAPCPCEKLGFFVGKVNLPPLLTDQLKRPGINVVTEASYGKQTVRAKSETVAGIVTGEGLQPKLAAAKSFNAYYIANNTLFYVASPKRARPSQVTLEVAQADPAIDLLAGETSWNEEMGEREVKYPQQFLRSLRLEALGKESTLLVNSLQLQDTVSDSASKPA